MNFKNISNSNDPFSDKIFKRLWGPALISSVGLAFADMADALFVGRTNGETGLAAIAICLPLYMIISIFMYGLGVGGSNRYSTLRSEGKKEEANACFNNMIQSSIIFGIILAVISYIFMDYIITILGAGKEAGQIHTEAVIYGRFILGASPFFMWSHVVYYLLCSDNREKSANICFAIACVFDILLNYLFVGVFGLGTFGAGLSTMLGQVVACVFYYIILIRNKENMPIYMKWMININETLQCFKNGFSTSIGYFWQIFYFSLVNNFLMKKMGSNGVAAFDILQNVSYLFMYIYDSVVKALEPIVTTYQGEKNRGGQRNALRLAIKYGNHLALVFMVIVFLIPDNIAHLFGITNPEALEYTRIALRTYTLAVIFMGISTIINGYEQAKGNDKLAYILSSLRGAVILFPVIICFCLINNERTFWLAFPVTEIISLAVFLFGIKLKVKQKDIQYPKVYNRVIKSKGDDIAEIYSSAEAYCEENGASPKQTMLVNMAIEETLAVIMNFAFENVEDGYISVTLFKNEERFELHFRDSADVFDPFSLNTSEITDENAANDDIMDTMGILMIKKRAESFAYRHHQGFNTLIITI